MKEHSMYDLKRLDEFHGRSGPLLLIILDGIGIGDEYEGNAFYRAHPKTLLKLAKECRERGLFCKLQASGEAVGLMNEKDKGNSEVGHNALGAGKIYPQGAKLVDIAIKKGKIFQTKLWKQMVQKVKTNDSTVHLIGLLSDGNVHSSINQLFRLLDGLQNSGIQNVRLHILTDGRDVPAKSALEYIHPLQLKLQEIRQKSDDNEYFDYRIASGGGRMRVTMDRYESDWKIVQRGWDAHVRGVVREDELKNGYKGYYSSAAKAIKDARNCFPKLNDQFLPPFVIVNDDSEPVGQIKDNDVVINFNFRGDRAIEISKAFEQGEEFKGFDRVVHPDVLYIGLTQYDGDEKIPENYFVHPPKIKDVLTDYCCANDITQFAIAETHKYGHVTYFWNGNRSGYFCIEKEKYVNIPSEPNEMIEEHPEMKAEEVCKQTITAIKSGEWDFIRV
ncbi:MAG: 2,3-bisphosphoglycerate-independent phosphoglycerate mutase, partial [Promethearchaeota archaeon]